MTALMSGVSCLRARCVVPACPVCRACVPGVVDARAQQGKPLARKPRHTARGGTTRRTWERDTRSGGGDTPWWKGGYGVPVPKTRIDAVKPCRWLRPPTGPISPAAKNPATPVVSSPERTASTS